MDLEEEISAGKNEEFQLFDSVVGHIEDIVVGIEYKTLHESFMETHWQHFENQEENKLIYTEIFERYCSDVEAFLNEQLKRRIPSFEMESFLEVVRSHKSSLDGEIFDLLTRFSDFLAFKEMMLDYRAVKEGRVADLSLGVYPSRSEAKNKQT